MEVRYAVVGILIDKRSESAPVVNKVLTEFGDMIVGRMGIPHRDGDKSIISCIVMGTTDEIGALSGKLGNVKGVKAKVSMLS